MASLNTLALIQQYEGAHGNPAAVNPTSGASGLYQWLKSSWQRVAPMAGVDVSQYPTASSAPAPIQTAVTAFVLDNPAQTGGVGNWTCTGCNPQFALAYGAGQTASPTYVSAVQSDLAAISNGGVQTADSVDTINAQTQIDNSSINPMGPAVPSVVDYSFAGVPDSTSVFAGQNLTAQNAGTVASQEVAAGTDASGGSISASGIAGAAGVVGDIAGGLGGIANATLGGIGGSISSTGTPLSQILNALGGWFARGGIIMLGGIIVAIALWSLAAPKGMKPQDFARKGLKMA